MNYFKNPMGPVEKAMRDYGVDITGIDFPGGVEEMSMDYFKNPMGLVEKAMRISYFVNGMVAGSIALSTSTLWVLVRGHRAHRAQSLRDPYLSPYPFGAGGRDPLAAQARFLEGSQPP